MSWLGVAFIAGASFLLCLVIWMAKREGMLGEQLDEHERNEDARKESSSILDDVRHTPRDQR